MKEEYSRSVHMKATAVGMKVGVPEVSEECAGLRGRSRVGCGGQIHCLDLTGKLAVGNSKVDWPSIASFADTNLRTEGAGGTPRGATAGHCCRCCA